MTVDYRPRLLEGRGFLVTAEEAAELIGVRRNVIDVWASRGHLPRAWPRRPVQFWSDDVYDAQHNLRPTRDDQGKFVARQGPL